MLGVHCSDNIVMIVIKFLDFIVIFIVFFFFTLVFEKLTIVDIEVIEIYSWSRFSHLFV